MQSQIELKCEDLPGKSASKLVKFVGDLDATNVESVVEEIFSLLNSGVVNIVADFEKLLENYPSVALGFSKMVGFRFTKLKNNYSNLVFKDVKTRLIYFFIDWAEKDGVEKKGAYHLENYLTHQNLASLICSTRQTVTEILNELQRSGLIAYSRTEICIPNLEQLKLITDKEN